MSMAENEQILGDRGKSLEDAFFRKESERAIERLREMKQRTMSREALAKVIGITNEAIIDRLIELGIRPEIVTALAIVPLVEVAWADGSLDAKERQAVLDRAEKSGIAAGTADLDLLRSWLDRRPEPRLLTAWTEMVRGLAERMSPQEVATLKAGLTERARAIARASGGFLGMGAVSAAEQDAIDRLESAFRSA
jgi:DNA-binding XRE family transcriptional regulator